jgi:translation initiation factor 5B
VFPAVLDILDQCVFNKKNPIVVGVKVLEGTLKTGTPLCFVKLRQGGVETVVSIGSVASIERNNQPVDKVRYYCKSQSTLQST